MDKVPKLIFIIPYKNRVPQKIHFEIYMKYILEDLPKEDYKIYFSHQLDNRSFNRGAVKNIGFLAMKKKYPLDYKKITFIFNDIDTIPCQKNLLNYYTTRGTIKHFYGFKFALGGIFSITGEDFEKCNGFPNFWGWGLEDNILNKRALENNINIDRSTFYTIGNLEILQTLDKPYRLINDRESTIKNSSEGIRDINNLEFIIENEFIQIKNFETREKYNKNEFYSRDISQPGAHKTLSNALNRLNSSNKKYDNSNNKYINLKKMF